MSNTGGVIGFQGSAYNCLVIGTNISGRGAIGGLIGYAEGNDPMYGLSLIESTITGTTNYIGGLVGLSYQSIKDSYVLNSYIKGGLYTGGLIGSFAIERSIINCYADVFIT
jgi:hypothetical protein